MIHHTDGTVTIWLSELERYKALQRVVQESPGPLLLRRMLDDGYRIVRAVRVPAPSRPHHERGEVWA